MTSAPPTKARRKGISTAARAGAAIVVAQAAAELRAVGFAQAFGVDPMPKQLAFVCSQKPRVAYIGGLGAGKTIAGALRAAVAILENPRSHGLIVAPTLDLAKVAFREIETIDEAMRAKTGKGIITRYDRNLNEAYTVWGRTVFVRSATLAERSIRGHKMAWAWMDESQEMARPGDVLQLCLARVRCVAAHRRSLWLTTTPHRGLVGAVRKLADLRERHPEMVGIYRAKTTDNPYLPEDYIEGMRLTFSKHRWEAEVMAKILRSQDVVLPEFDTKKHVIPWVSLPGNPWILGCDWGVKNPGFLVIERDEVAWLGIDGKERTSPIYVVVDEYCPMDGEAIERQNLWFEQLRHAREHAPLVCGVDRADEWMQIRTLRRFGWRVKTNEDDQRINPGIEVIRSCLDPVEGPPRLFLSESFVQKSRNNERGLFWSLQNYRWAKDPYGQTLDHPRQEKWLHCCDALRYVLLAAGETYYQRSPGFSQLVAPHAGLRGHDRLA